MMDGTVCVWNISGTWKQTRADAPARWVHLGRRHSPHYICRSDCDAIKELVGAKDASNATAQRANKNENNQPTQTTRAGLQVEEMIYPLQLQPVQVASVECVPHDAPSAQVRTAGVAGRRLPVESFYVNSSAAR